MQLGLEGKSVLVTGGSKGIGLACAKAFMSAGARVAICSRDQANIEAALTTMPGARGFTADLTEAAAAAAVLARVEADQGPLDILVNSAGAAIRVPPAELTPAAWRAAMDAKFFTTINVADPAVKAMAARGRGVIVNIIGAGGKTASATHIAGGAANAALMLATAGLALAYAQTGVRIIGINPGLTETGRVTQGLEAAARLAGISPEQARANSLKAIPLGRMAKPEDIANMALFLASDRASYVCGTIITMDGLQSPII